MAQKQAKKKHVCQRCGKECPTVFCAACSILISAEALDERGGLLGGKKGAGPPTVEIAHRKRGA